MSTRTFGHCNVRQILCNGWDRYILCLLCLFAGASCASDKSSVPTRSSNGSLAGAAANTISISPTASAGTATATSQSLPTGASANSSAGASASNPQLMRPPPPAAGCEPNALDQSGCACDKPGATRPCYSADPKTRNVGMCKDGIQTCTGDNSVGVEFGGQWGACKEQVIPTECKEQLDARCVGKVGCDDPECASKLSCAKDAGTPDAGNRHCHTVMGWGKGTGFFPDGGMWCER